MKDVESRKSATNFPKAGDNRKVSLRNSNFNLFPVRYAEDIRDNYPDVWAMGGNIAGNSQFRKLVPIAKRKGAVKSESEEKAVRKREAWAARHYKNFRIAGVIAQMKWLVVGEKGLSYMKNLIRGEITRRENNSGRAVSNLEEKMENKTIAGSGLVCESVQDLENGSKCYSFAGRIRANFPIHELTNNISSGDADNVGPENRNIEHEDSATGSLPENLEERASPEEDGGTRTYMIEGIASSTSIDSHGTEMARSALQKMSHQIKSGIPILPSHASHNANGIGEWDEVIGRTLQSDIIPERNVKNAADGSEQQYLMKVRSVLYMDEPKTQALLRRLERGEPIGQSIGGWFENIDVIENEGKIERVIVNDVTLDHIAITRAPSNPDSINLMTLSARNALVDSVMELRKAIPATKMPLAPIDTPWDWDTDASNEVLGDPANWDRFSKAHLYVIEGEEEKKSGYKLPVAKMMDGELKIVYRGVIAAMSALNGARGGVDIPEKDRSKIYENIKRYYEMFEKEAPPLRSEDFTEDLPPAIEPQENLSLVETQDSTNNKTEEEWELDIRSETGHNDAVEAHAEDSATTKSSGEDMTDNDFAKFAELLNGAIGPLAERVAALESAPEKEKVEKVEVRKDSAEVEDLKRRLQKAEDMITRVIETPIRRGSHSVPRSGMMAEDMYTRTAIAAEKEGLTALPKLVKRQAEKLADKNNKLNKNDLTEMLVQGLRAAQMDGLLNHSINCKLWQ